MPDRETPESQENIDESNAFAEGLFAAFDVTLNAFAEYHPVVEITTHNFGLSARDKVLRELWLRTFTWLKTVRRLDEACYYQAIATACRSVFELLIDVALVTKGEGDELALKMIAWADSEKFEACRQIVKYFEDTGVEFDKRFSIQLAFYQDFKEIIINSREIWWNGRHPRRWTGNNDLLIDVREVDRLYGDSMSDDLENTLTHFYRTEYRRISWQIHSGLTSTWNMPAESFIITSGFCFKWISQMAMLVAKIVLLDLGVAKAVPDIRQHWKDLEQARLREFNKRTAGFTE